MDFIIGLLVVLNVHHWFDQSAVRIGQKTKIKINNQLMAPAVKEQKNKKNK